MATSVQDQRLPFARLAHRDLDLSAYFHAADRTLARIVPFDASCWLSLDPGSALPTSHFSRQFGVPHLMELVANEFLEDDVNKFTDLAHASRPVGVLSEATGGCPERSRRHARFLVSAGFADGDELRAVFRDGTSAWGAVALHRRHGTFFEREVESIDNVGPILAQGIRRAVLRSSLGANDDRERPGLIVLGPDDRLERMTPGADTWLGDLFDSEAATGKLPLPILSVAQQARRVAAGLSIETATVLLPRRSGGWLRADGSVLGDRDPQSVAVIVAPSRDPEVAALIAQAYGMSAREREVTGLVLRGYSTNEIAENLGLSAYTVQDHLKSIFEKVGVRSRRELVAQLFMQQCAPRLTRGAPPAADGWFQDARAEAP